MGNSVKDFEDRVKTRYRDARNHQKEWKEEARMCYEMVAGHQYTDTEKAELEEALRPCITFNRIDPVISAVDGHQINNRTEVRYSPRQLGDVKINEMLTSAAQYVDDNSDAEDEQSEAFHDAVVCGMGWTETRVAYDEDPNGKIWGAERISPMEMGWDPNAKKRNLSDARYLFHDKWWDKDEAEKRWPKVKQIDFSQQETWQDDPDMWGDEPHDASRAWMYENDSSRYYRKHSDEIRISRYMYYELVPVYMVGDPQTREPIELDQKKFNRMKQRLDEIGVRYVKQERREYKQAWFCGDILLEKEDGPCKYSYPFKCITGKRDETKNHWYGLVRAMIDPQKWSNKFFAEIQDILATNRTGGAFVEETALVDARKAEETWSDANPLIMVQDGALAAGRIQERNPITYPAGLDRMMEFAVQSIPHVTGLSMEMLGLADRDQPNVLEVTRKRAGMTILATLFNSLRRYSKERGRLLAWYIHEYISDGRLIKVMQGDGTEQYVQLFKDNAVEVMDQDIIVDESPASPNQKQETFAVLMEIVPQALQAGLPVPPELLDYMPIPSQLTEKWKEMISNMKEDPQVAQLKKRLMDLEVAQKEADVQKTKSEVTENQMNALLDRMKALEIKMNTKIAPYEAVSQMADRGAAGVPVTQQNKPNGGNQ